MHNQFLLVDAYFSIGRRLYKSNQLPLTRAQPTVAPGLGWVRAGTFRGGGGVWRAGAKPRPSQTKVGPKAPALWALGAPAAPRGAQDSAQPKLGLENVQDELHKDQQDHDGHDRPDKPGAVFDG